MGASRNTPEKQRVQKRAQNQVTVKVRKAAIVPSQKTKQVKKQDLTRYCAAGSEPELFIYRQRQSAPSLIPPLTVKSGISAEEPDLLAC